MNVHSANTFKLQRLILFLGIALAAVLNTASGQQDGLLQIESIQFIGNRKNQESHLLRALQARSGDQVNLDLLQAEAQSLRNLNSVSNATYRLDTVSTGLVVSYDIEEALTIFPIVSLGGVSNNFWWQLGFKDLNWQGRGDNILVVYQNIDHRNNFNLEYRRGYFGASRWGGSLNLRRYASVEPFNFPEFDPQVFYEYTNTSASAGAIYNLDYRQTFEFGLTYFIEDYLKDVRHRGEDTPGPADRREPKLLIKAIHQIDRIDYTYFIQDGWANQLILQSVYNVNGGYLFHMFLNNLTYFKETPWSGNLAARFRFGLSSNDLSPFAPFVLDSYLNIRGVGNRIDRGTAAIIFNLEYRQRIFETGLFGAQAVIFSDAGTWRNPGGSFGDLTDRENFRHFVGGGLRLILKKAHNASLRLDYGFSVRKNNNDQGFVFGIGQYF